MNFFLYAKYGINLCKKNYWTTNVKHIQRNKIVVMSTVIIYDFLSLKIITHILREQSQMYKTYHNELNQYIYFFLP